MKVPGSIERLATPAMAWLARRNSKLAGWIVGVVGEDVDEIVQWHMAGRRAQDEAGWHTVSGNPESGSRPPDYKTSTVLGVDRETNMAHLRDTGGRLAVAYAIEGDWVMAAKLTDPGRKQAETGRLEVAVREGVEEGVFALGALRRRWGRQTFMPVVGVEVLASGVPNAQVPVNHPNAVRV